MTPSRPKRTTRASKGKNVVASPLPTKRQSKKKTIASKSLTNQNKFSIGSPKTSQKSLKDYYENFLKCDSVQAQNPSSDEKRNESPDRNTPSPISIEEMCVKMTLDEFQYNTNIIELVKEYWLQKNHPEKLLAKMMKNLNFYIERVYNLYISKPKYRRDDLFKKLKVLPVSINIEAAEDSDSKCTNTQRKGQDNTKEQERKRKVLCKRSSNESDNLSYEFVGDNTSCSDTNAESVNSANKRRKVTKSQTAARKSHSNKDKPEHSLKDNVEILNKERQPAKKVRRCPSPQEGCSKWLYKSLSPSENSFANHTDKSYQSTNVYLPNEFVNDRRYADNLSPKLIEEICSAMSSKEFREETNILDIIKERVDCSIPSSGSTALVDSYAERIFDRYIKKKHKRRHDLFVDLQITEKAVELHKTQSVLTGPAILLKASQALFEINEVKEKPCPLSKKRKHNIANAESLISQEGINQELVTQHFMIEPDNAVGKDCLPMVVIPSVNIRDSQTLESCKIEKLTQLNKQGILMTKKPCPLSKKLKYVFEAKQKNGNNGNQNQISSSGNSDILPDKFTSSNSTERPISSNCKKRTLTEAIPDNASKNLRSPDAYQANISISYIDTNTQSNQSKLNIENIKDQSRASICRLAEVTTATMESQKLQGTANQEAMNQGLFSRKENRLEVTPPLKIVMEEPNDELHQRKINETDNNQQICMRNKHKVNVTKEMASLDIEASRNEKMLKRRCENVTETHPKMKIVSLSDNLSQENESLKSKIAALEPTMQMLTTKKKKQQANSKQESILSANGVNNSENYYAAISNQIEDSAEDESMEDETIEFENTSRRGGHDATQIKDYEAEQTSTAALMKTVSSPEIQNEALSYQPGSTKSLNTTSTTSNDGNDNITVLFTENKTNVATVKVEANDTSIYSDEVEFLPTKDETIVTIIDELTDTEAMLNELLMATDITYAFPTANHFAIENQNVDDIVRLTISNEPPLTVTPDQASDNVITSSGSSSEVPPSPEIQDNRFAAKNLHVEEARKNSIENAKFPNIISCVKLANLNPTTKRSYPKQGKRKSPSKFSPLEFLSNTQETIPVKSKAGKIIETHISDEIVSLEDLIEEEISQQDIDYSQAIETSATLQTNSQLLNADLTYLRDAKIPSPIKEIVISAVANFSKNKTNDLLKSDEPPLSSVTCNVQVPVALNRHIRHKNYICLTCLDIRSVVFGKYVNRFHYESNSPFLETSKDKQVRATINVNLGRCRSLQIVGKTLQILFGFTNKEWCSVMKLFDVIELFEFKSTDPEPTNKSLPHRILYYLFKTVPKFSQATLHSVETGSDDQVSCVNMNINYFKPICSLKQAFHPMILDKLKAYNASLL